MTTILDVTMKNILSVGGVTQAIRLTEHGLTLVLGSNTDANGGITRNGAGKTTILQSISYGLFGKPLTRIKVDNLVNNINGKGMMVTITFERDGKRYRVERGRKPVVLRLFVNDKEMTFEDEKDISRGENVKTQEEIERVLGMTHTMFSHIVALNTFTDPFLKMKVADQRVVIEELLGVTQLSMRAESLKKLVAQSKLSIQAMEARIRTIEEANTRITSTIQHTTVQEAAWTAKRETTLRDIADSLGAIDGIDFDAEIAAFDALDLFRVKEREVKADVERTSASMLVSTTRSVGLQRELSGYTAARNAINPALQLRRMEVELSRKADEVSRHDAQMVQLAAELETIEHDLTHTDSHSCRSCGQGLSGTDHLATILANLEKMKAVTIRKIEHEEKGRADRTAEIAAITAEAGGVEDRAAQDIAAINLQIEDVEAKLVVVRGNIAALEQQTREGQEIVASLGVAPETMFRSRDEVYKTKALYDTLVRDRELELARENPYTSQVASLKQTLMEIDREPLIELQDLVKHQELLLKLLTNKDSFIRKKIVDQNLTYLNSRLNSYLDKLGLPHEVKFQADLSVDITLLGRDFDFEQLSRGEMNRVIMATSWAFRDVWESLNEPINLYFIDEVLDQGTCNQGAEAALGVLKAMARDRGKNVFLISHRDELAGQIDHTLLVRKQDGFSHFEEDVTV